MKYKIKLRVGGVTVGNDNRKKLNISILQSKQTVVVSSEEALKNITPINWSEDVLTGKKKVIVS